jgi:hypothetical protein
LVVSLEIVSVVDAGADVCAVSDAESIKKATRKLQETRSKGTSKPVVAIPG